jgi:AcrR family transcriptional regulator
MPTPTRTLSTADERRETVLAAAQRVFGARGLHGTPTTEIAHAAGISHAYLFRLFPTKTELVVAAVQASNQRIIDTFAAAARDAESDGRDAMEAMGHAYADLLADRELLLMQLHSYAASPDMPEVREAARDCFARLVDLVERSTGAAPDEIRTFFAHGMLMNVMAAIDADSSDAHWAQALRKSPDDAH